mmetsp:Transcript_150532/g.273989  ORF Transcript_150532/g.273989 Transcript_150532/m.273989 type:complete len:168 (+) Transcript_150532:37-540(+)
MALPSSLAGISTADLDGSSGKQTLFLKSRSISDTDCQDLAPLLSRNKALRQLYIGYNSFGDDGTKLLCDAFAAVEGGQLELLGLRHCNLGDGAAEALAALLKTNGTIVEIGIDENRISDAGAEALAGALGSNSTLRHLYVGENLMTDSGKKKLTDAKPSHLSIHFTR